jgi:hypothetical protein
VCSSKMLVFTRRRSRLLCCENVGSHIIIIRSVPLPNSSTTTKQKVFNLVSVFRCFLAFFPVPVYAVTASGVPGGTLVSMNRFSTLCV